MLRITPRLVDYSFNLRTVYFSLNGEGKKLQYLVMLRI